MKKLLLLLVFLLAITLQSQAQPTTHVLIDTTTANGYCHSEYYIDSSKMLHWSMDVESNTPYEPDLYSWGYENMVQFIAGAYFSLAPGSTEVYLNDTDFPYQLPGGPVNYFGTIDLSAFTWTEILNDFTIQTQFCWIPPGEIATRSGYYFVALSPVVN